MDLEKFNLIPTEGLHFLLASNLRVCMSLQKMYIEQTIDIPTFYEFDFFWNRNSFCNIININNVIIIIK